MKRKSILFLIILLIAVAGSNGMVKTANAAADACTWTGDGLTTNWSDSDNWTGCDNGSVPENADELIFPSSPNNLNTTNDLVGLALFRITFEDTYEVNGNAFSVSAGIGASSGNTEINNDVTLAGSATILTSGGGGLIFSNDSSLNLNGFNLALQIGGNSLILDCVVSGTGSIFKMSSGQVHLQQNNTFTGTLTATGGSVNVYSNNSLGSTAGSTVVGSNVTVNILADGLTIPENFSLAGSGNVGGGSLRNYGGVTATINGNITLSATTTIQSDPGHTLTLNGVISGGFSSDLTVVGTVIMNNNNSYAGNTTLDGIAGADLTINGSQDTGGVIINQGGTVRGNGTITHLYLGSAGSTPATLSPGLPGEIGTLTTTGNFTNGNPEMNMDIDIAASDSDQLAVSGDVILDDTQLNLALLSAPTAGAEFTIIDNAGGDSVSGIFNGLAEGATFVVGGYSFTISYVGGDGNDVTLTLVNTQTSGGVTQTNSNSNANNSSELASTGGNAYLYLLVTFGLIAGGLSVAVRLAQKKV